MVKKEGKMTKQKKDKTENKTESFDFDLNFDMDFDSENYNAKKKIQDAVAEEEKNEVKGTAKRRKVHQLELSLKYEYRRAFSEIQLLDCDIEIKENHSYNFITAGDVDALSYLKLMIRHIKKIDYLLLSTWCMNYEDILQIKKWIKEGVLNKVDFYLGEIFPNQYRLEWQMLNDFYKERPETGRIAVFKNHSKIFAGYSTENNFYFGIQTSANIQTNPRCENGCITISREIFEFYKKYFDGIKSFV